MLSYKDEYYDNVDVPISFILYFDIIATACATNSMRVQLIQVAKQISMYSIYNICIISI